MLDIFRTARCSIEQAADVDRVLYPLLIERVFHITGKKGLAALEEGDVIESNQDGRFAFGTPGSENSYFRKRGYVCCFDFRGATHADLVETEVRYSFLTSREDGAGSVFVFLNSAAIGRVVESSDIGSDLVVSEFEVGLKRGLSPADVEDILVVEA